ncbi:osmosensor SHO1 [Sugiyamaella lignohabitans]|uniref:High osmolarity signaling protein SHO1 n=1 Tax=Sugiyamaella lignohabitans TaxID=796027 RepID=A0A167CI45_9ASCO|nr:osmosensor SHO1 [Sugiyamaella lignohabitans]ANB11730.1 osmosensor SHO1 [Sugiyamaella lignohabitans]
MGSYTERTDSYIRRSALKKSPSFNWSYILSDAFFLSTITIAIIGWIIAFAGSVSVDVKGAFPTLTWWGIVFEFFLILGVIYVVGADAFYSYRLALCAFLATGTIYTTNSTNNFVWTSTPSEGAAAAGHILLSIINILWIFYFGTAEDEPIHAFIDSFALNKELRTAASMSRRSTNPFTSGRGLGAQDLSGRGQGMDMTYRPGDGSRGMSTAGYPQMFTSAQLGAFENSSDHGAGGSSGNGSNLLIEGNKASYMSHGSNGTGLNSSLHAPVEYPYRAKAIYSYTANPEDDNEISFEKDEILEVSDITGRWWQARRANGEVGICPSNYVALES